MILLLLNLMFYAQANFEDNLVKNAKQDNKIIVLKNTLIYGDYLMEAFQKKYPFIEFDVETYDPLRNPAPDRPLVDIIFACERIDLYKFVHNQYLQKLNDLPNWSHQPKYRKNDYFFKLVGAPHGIIYNTKIHNEATLPKTYSELLSKKWQNKIIIRNMYYGSTGQFLVEYFHHNFGQGRYFKKLAQNKPYVTHMSSEVFTSVNEGKYEIGLTREIALVSYRKLNHEYPNLKFKFLEDKLPYQYQYAFWTERSKNNPAAKLFMNWLMSQEAEDVLFKKGLSAGKKLQAERSRPNGFWELDTDTKLSTHYKHLQTAYENLSENGAIFSKHKTQEANLKRARALVNSTF